MTARITILLLLSFYGQLLFAQARQIIEPDSIEQINAILDRAKSLSSDSPDSALEIVNNMLPIAIKLKHKAGVNEALVISARSLRVLGRYDTASSLLDSLIDIGTVNGDSALIANGLYEKGNLAIDKGEYEKSIEILQLAMKIRLAIGDKKGVAAVYNVMGNSYADLGYYYQALNVYQKALSIDEEIGNKVGLGSRYNNMARIYVFTKEYQKAANYYQKAYDIAVIIDSKTDQAIYSNNLAHLLKLQGRYNEALVFLYKSLKIRTAQNTTCGKMYPMYNLGSIYMQKGMLDSAAHYLNAVLPNTLICENDQYLRCLTLIDLAQMHMQKGEFRIGRNYLLEALNSAQRYQLPAEALTASKILSQVYDSLNLTDQSLKYFRMYHELYDSLNNTENAKKLARLEAQYEFRQQQQQDSLKQRLQQLENETELSNAIWMRNSFIVGFIFLGIVTLMIFINYNRKNKANEKLSELNKQIILQKTELEAQAEELKSANEEITRINENLEQIVNARTALVKEQNKKIVEYVYYNSHKVRGPLARILGLVALFERNGINTEEMHDKLAEIKKEAVELDAMVRQMNRSLEKQKESFDK